jgi:hypothetical protein
MRRRYAGLKIGENGVDGFGVLWRFARLFRCRTWGTLLARGCGGVLLFDDLGDGRELSVARVGNDFFDGVFLRFGFGFGFAGFGQVEAGDL